MLTNSKKKVYDAIRHKLLTAALKPGARLSEATLAKEMGVSRTPVREALIQLGRDGLLEIMPHVGTYVKKLNRDEIAELFDLREMLETYAAARTAQRINEVELDEMRKNCLMMESLNKMIIGENIGELSETLSLRLNICDVAFHSSLIAAANSPRVSRIIRDFHILTNLCLHGPRDKTLKLHDDLVRVVEDHAAIVRALESRDAEKAASHIRGHIREGKRQALASYQADEGTPPAFEHDSDSIIEKILGY